MQDYLMQLAIAMLPVWGATEVLGRILRMGKDKVALGLGLLVALAGNGAGLVSAPGGQVWSWVFAVVGGLLVGAGAGLINDYVAKPTIATITPPKE